MSASLEPQKSRQFFCPCGKGYYSYAALFTHVKQKHQGKAPGQIIKPKPENKRGRPRKPQACPQIQLFVKEQMKEQGGILHSSHSQFKSYQGENEQLPTANSLPSQEPNEHSLLEDLTSSLEGVSTHKMPPALLSRLPSIALLEDPTSELISCISDFLSSCEQCLPLQTSQQIKLLLGVLLQHVSETLPKGQELPQLQRIHLNDYIDSFFDGLRGYLQRWSLIEEPIFYALNPMKVLVVLYNWINSAYLPRQILQTAKQEEDPEPFEEGISVSASFAQESE